MVSEKVTLVNKQGLHMRPAGYFAREMAPFSCDVNVVVAGEKPGDLEKVVNAKTPMTLMAAAIRCGAEIEIRCDGEDENEALAHAVALIKSGLGE